MNWEETVLSDEDGLYEMDSMYWDEGGGFTVESVIELLKAQAKKSFEAGRKYQMEQCGSCETPINKIIDRDADIMSQKQTGKVEDICMEKLIDPCVDCNKDKDNLQECSSPCISPCRFEEMGDCFLYREYQSRLQGRQDVIKELDDKFSTWGVRHLFFGDALKKVMNTKDIHIIDIVDWQVIKKECGL